MKYLFSIIMMLVVAKECDKKNLNPEKQSTYSEINDNKESSKIQEQDYVVVYSALSRGFFKEITINNSTISVQKNRNEEPNTQPCSDELWREISGRINRIDLESLTKLEAPTGKRLYDGAAHATLKIIVDGKTYTSSTFDHGHPPKEIATICNVLYKLIEE